MLIVNGHRCTCHVVRPTNIFRLELRTPLIRTTVQIDSRCCSRTGNRTGTGSASQKQLGAPFPRTAPHRSRAPACSLLVCMSGIAGFFFLYPALGALCPAEARAGPCGTASPPASASTSDRRLRRSLVVGATDWSYEPGTKMTVEGL
jgi:hypothetical protein